MNTDFSEFKFRGRHEFFEPPLNSDALFPLIVEAYRRGFARGCRAGADDVVDYIGLTGDERKVASDAFWQGWWDMCGSIPHRKADTIMTRCDIRPIKSLKWQAKY